ncbi:MAG TPA: beta-galactosidase, partial [Candidatus Methylacidiphilales bacterium]
MKAVLKVLALLCCGLALSPASGGAEERALFTFGPGGYPAERVRCEDAKVSLSPTKGLQVALGKDARWPGIAFEGPWNLSEDACLNVEIVNQGTSPLKLEVLLYDDPVRDWKKALFRREYFAPGEAKTVSLQLVRKAVPGDPVVLSGMNGIPPGLPAVRGLNLQRVLLLVLSKTQNGTASTIEIRRVYASGKYQARDPKDLLPLVDRFGQDRHAEWPGKIHSEEELRASADNEEKDLARYPEPEGRDRFGGWASGPQLAATGRFRTEKYRDKWHLVDPEGRLFFSLGINNVNASAAGSSTPLTAERKTWFESLPSPNDWSGNGRFYNVRQIYTGDYSGRTEPGFSFLAWNLSRKYGGNWETTLRDLAHRRLRSWGYNTLGNWSEASIERMERTPFTAGVALAGNGARVLGGGPWSVGKVWDPYDPAFAGGVDRLIGNLKELGSSPWCVGIFFDNELYWDEDFGLTALRSDAGQPAKQEFVRDLQKKYGDISRLNQVWRTSYGDWEALLNGAAETRPEGAQEDFDAFYLKTAEAYFRTIRDSIRRQIPGCLYLGPRFARVTPLAYQAAARYCDVVSLNLYLRNLRGYRPPTDADVPLMVGEFHFGALDRGMWGSGLVPVKSQEERAQALREYVDSALRHPQFVGCHWFEYYDQPLTG